jgi:hypothetical protein
MHAGSAPQPQPPFLGPAWTLNDRAASAAIAASATCESLIDFICYPFRLR